MSEPDYKKGDGICMKCKTVIRLPIKLVDGIAVCRGCGASFGLRLTPEEAAHGIGQIGKKR